MSIKQNGGVFGRNPTFNDVTIEGQLTFDGDIDINSDLKINGALEVDGGDVTISAGNLVIGTSGKGIDFSATAGTGTSELFSDYEQGVWSPTIVGSTSGSITGFSVSDATYTKIGDTVRLSCYLSNIDMTSSTVSGQIKIGGLPFSSDSFADVAAVTHCTMFSFDESTTSVSGYLSGSDVLLRKGSSVIAITDADESSLTTAQIMLSVTYKVA